MHGSYYRAFQRSLSTAPVPMTAVAFVTSYIGHAVLDGLLGVTLVYQKPLLNLAFLFMSFRFQFDSSVTDYLHIRKFPVIGQIAKWVLRGVLPHL